MERSEKATYQLLWRATQKLKEIFGDWLQTHYPDRSEHVLSLIKQASGGKSYDYRFGHRQSGRGPYADMLAARFAKASRALGLLPDTYQQSLDCGRFLHPAKRQLGLAF